MEECCANCKYIEKIGDAYFCNKQDGKHYGGSITGEMSCIKFEADYYSGWRLRFYEAVKNMER